MSIHESDRTSSLDPGPDRVIGRGDAEAGEPGIGGDEEHERSLSRQEEVVESGKAEEVESDEEEEEHEAPAVAPLAAANAKTTFGLKRSNPTVKKGVKTIIPLLSYLMNF